MKSIISNSFYTNKKYVALTFPSAFSGRPFRNPVSIKLEDINFSSPFPSSIYAAIFFTPFPCNTALPGRYSNFAFIGSIIPVSSMNSLRAADSQSSWSSTKPFGMPSAKQLKHYTSHVDTPIFEHDKQYFIENSNCTYLHPVDPVG